MMRVISSRTFFLSLSTLTACTNGGILTLPMFVSAQHAYLFLSELWAMVKKSLFFMLSLQRE